MTSFLSTVSTVLRGVPGVSGTGSSTGGGGDGFMIEDESTGTGWTDDSFSNDSFWTESTDGTLGFWSNASTGWVPPDMTGWVPPPLEDLPVNPDGSIQLPPLPNDTWQQAPSCPIDCYTSCKQRDIKLREVCKMKNDLHVRAMKAMGCKGTSCSTPAFSKSCSKKRASCAIKKSCSSCR